MSNGNSQTGKLNLIIVKIVQLGLRISQEIRCPEMKLVYK